MKLAIVGSGIAGLAVAHTLQGRADITLFEAGDYFGGHTHTVDITLPTAQGPVTYGIDTGFLVFNERTYPNLINLLAELDVATARSDMSFSVQVPHGRRDQPLEWSGSSLNTVFAQRGNLLDWRFLTMLRDVLRFNRLATRLATRGHDAELMQPLADFLRQHRFGAEFRDWYFLPMIGCIWSCPTDQMLRFPVATMVRFCHNHGLLQVRDRPQWWTVAGGARRYVDKIVGAIGDKRLNTPVRLIERDEDGVRIITDAGGRSLAERFDKVVLAAHADQSLAMLRDASTAERATLGAFRYQPNRAVLHLDASVLPRHHATWAAWNFERAAGADAGSEQVCLHYLINRLQPLPFTQPVLVSLNPQREIARNQVMGEFNYAHPVFDLAAIRAQADLPALQGQRHTYYCGAWMGYGFHEDGLKAGLGVAGQLLRQAPQGPPGGTP
ncbi:MAG: NAD(P)/FAD-dependent oxidoreductase [Rhodoferax sp.]